MSAENVTLSRGVEPGTPEDAELARVLDGYLAAVEAGRAPDPERLLAEHPAIAERLRACLAGLRLVEQVAGSFGGTAARGDTAEREPECLGDFRIVRQVGRGGMGVVYEAEQRSLKRQVALKVLPFAATLDPKQLQRFHNEAQAAAGLHHSNIVPIYGVGCERGVHYYAMQFIDGQTLAEVIRQLRQLSGRGKAGPDPSAAPGPPPDAAPASGLTRSLAAVTTEGGRLGPEFFRRAAEWGIQAAEALDHAHQLGVVHRDVKPANLLIDARGQLWVTDFGLARIQSETSLSATGDLVGTLRYMSPEQALARRMVLDHRTDVYSLGATLYELLTLQPAFWGNDREELLRQIAREEPVPPRRLDRAVPAELETIVLKALEKDPADRYATARELADDLKRFLEDRPILARRPTLRQRAARWARRHRAAVKVGGVLVFLAALLGAGAWGWRAVERRAADREADYLLHELDRLQGEGKLPEAVSAARSAGALASGSPVSPALGRRLRERYADLEMAARLEDARLQETVQDGNAFDVARGDPAYEAAFRDYGIDVLRLSPAEAAALLRGRTIPVELGAALTDWARVRRRTRPEGDRAWMNLLALARAADPDDERNGLRDALERLDRPALLAVAGSERATEMPPSSLSLLGEALRECGAVDEAIALLRRAQIRHPDDFGLNNELGWALTHQEAPRPDQAVRYYAVAAALRPQNAGACYNLGLALLATGAVEESAAALRQACRLRPEYVEAHYNLGNALARAGRLDDAIIEFRQALQIKGDDAVAHNNLGNALLSKGRLDEAIAEFREATRFRKDYALAHSNLGNALRMQGQLDEAIAECHEAIRFDPKLARAHNNLGVALKADGRLDAAIAAYQDALRIDKDYALAHSNLGSALYEKGRLDDAIAEYRRALDLRKDLPEAWRNLGSALAVRGRLGEAVAAFREALRLRPNFAEARKDLEKVETQARLADRLPDVLQGKARPGDAAECLAFASMCGTYREEHATAVRFYADAFARQPALAEDLQAGYRYLAAAAAARAGCGQGKDADRLDDREKARLRRQARDWLRADLDAWERLLNQDPEKNGPRVRGELRLWLEDREFSGVREPGALARLPEAERGGWQELLRDVEALRRRAGVPPKKAEPTRP